MDLRVQIDKVSNGFVLYDSFRLKSRVFTNLDELLEELKKLLSNLKGDESKDEKP